jgi:hypothetical protein
VFEIAMDDTLGVAVFYTFDNLFKEDASLGLG